MLHFRLIYDEILKSNVFASSRPGRTDARVILILALLLKYKRLRRKMILFLIQHIDPCIQETGSMGQRTVKTCIERGWIKMQEQRGAREKGLYSITQAGKKHLYELINEYFQGETVQNMVSVLDAYAAGRTNMELSQHKEAEIAAALKMVLSDYREKWTQLEFEVPYSVEAMREYGGQAKKRGDVFADLKLSYRCTDHQEERPICIEIDMGTERVSTHGGLLFKCNAYAEVNRRMRQISLHQAINVMFVFSNDPGDDLQQTDLLKFESIKRYQQPLLPFLSFICRQQDLEASVTLGKMEQALVKVKECDAFGYEKKQFYRDAEFFLHVLKEQCSNQEQAGEKEILACMAEISDFCRNHLETSRTEYSRQYALKKRMDLFEQIRKNNSYALAGLRNGMSLSCNSHQDFDQEIPFLFPELYFRDQFGVLLFHLGIIKETVSKDNTKNGLRSATSTYSPGIDEREWLTKIYEAEARRHPSQRIRWGTEQLAACFAFMNGATHLGGLDGNYDGAFIGSLNTSAAAGGVSNAMMLNAIKNDVVLTESDYRILKIDRDTLLYLLQKAYDYETQYLLQRSITVYGLREYQIEHEDEEGRWYEDAEEYVIKQIIVSNEDTECMLRLDWQMLYMYSILASMGREDRGETEGIWDWEITIKDVDVAFDQIAMKYDYAFNVMTDEKSEYDFATCQSLPHKTEIYGDPDTTSGRYTWYYPNSLLRSASSGYSDLAYTYSGGEINGIVETYQNERYKGIPAALTRYYNFDRFHTLAKYMPGGTEALSRYEAYNQRAVMGNPIIYSGNFEVSMGEWNLVSE